jgi:tagatose-1,6-bisphosphate aldolase
MGIKDYVIQASRHNFYLDQTGSPFAHHVAIDSSHRTRRSIVRNAKASSAALLTASSKRAHDNDAVSTMENALP